MSNPLISIGVASFNNSTYIRETLDSIRALNYPNLELIVVDDASRDDSVAVIEGWLAENADFNARLVAFPVNKGVCHVCNTLIQESKGKYFSLIGSDDLYLPEKLSVQVPLLEAAGPEVGVVFSDVSKIDPQGNIIVPSVYVTGQISPSEGDVWLPMLRTNFIGAMTTLVRRSSLDEAGPYDESLAYEDWDMWLRLSRVCRFIYQPEVTALYRIHGNSAMHKRKIQIIETNMRLLNKQLGVSAEGDAIIHQHIADFAEELYLLGSPESSRWLAERYRLRPDRRGLSLLWLARLGIPATTVARAYRWLKKIKGSAAAPNP